MKMMNKKIAGMFALSILLLSIFSTFVLAQDGIKSTPTSTSVASKVVDPIKSMFSDWESGNLSVNITKYLLTVLVVMLVYSVVRFLPVVKKLHGFFRFLLALIVGFLSMAYTSSSEIYAVIVSYTAMGFVLGAMIPMVILLFFSIEMAKEKSGGGKMLAKVMWICFIGFMIYKLIVAMHEDLINPGMSIAYIAVIVGSIAWIFFAEKAFLKSLFKSELSTMQDANLRDQLANTVAEIAERDERNRKLSGNAKKEHMKLTDAMRMDVKVIESKLNK